jgi:hypothetical protein
MQSASLLRIIARMLSIVGVRLLDVMLDRDVDLLSYIRWDGDVSHVNLIKQKLIDMRISLESASIQRKKESIIDIEKLCEQISYRAGEDAKFDIMMTMIRTYRYSLHEQDKADELEDKMRNGMFICSKDKHLHMSNFKNK